MALYQHQVHGVTIKKRRETLVYCEKIILSISKVVRISTNQCWIWGARHPRTLAILCFMPFLRHNAWEGGSQNLWSFWYLSETPPSRPSRKPGCILQKKEERPGFLLFSYVFLMMLSLNSYTATPGPRLCRLTHWVPLWTRMRPATSPHLLEMVAPLDFFSRIHHVPRTLPEVGWQNSVRMIAIL